MEGGQPWRFAGTNMYWLGLDENCVPPTTGKCVDYPTQYRIEDALLTAVGMGYNLVRAHTLGVSTGNPRSLEPSRGQFNLTAFNTIDYSIHVAKSNGIRLVIPLTDNWNYYHGGYHDFTGWHGKACTPFPVKIPTGNCLAFYTDTSIVSDFKQYITYLLTHVNNYTGVALKDEPTILAWETGNELQQKGPPFTTWTEDIAQHIKQTVGAKQLVLDGRDTIRNGVDGAALSNPSVDMYTDHFYESWPSATGKVHKDCSATHSANKVYYVGEYGPRKSTPADLTPFLQAINITGSNGDTWWSLFPHGDNYGYVNHNDGYTLHFPGESTQASTLVDLLHNHALKMRGLPVVPYPPPTTPPLITGFKGQTVAWRGSAMAATYNVERSTAAGGPWSVVGKDIPDTKVPWTDVTQPSSGNVYYRIQPYGKGHSTPGPYSPVAKKE